jgi:2-polyprenyl-3-methyl-5-hydroxy-6-metoxy-1,4-benzoquinol methylase
MALIYNDGTYLSQNPTWHEEDSPFKARAIDSVLKKNRISFSNICEVGCGTGGVLRNLRKLVGNGDAKWSGFDISEEAIALAKRKPESGGIEFQNRDVFSLEESFDVMLVIDVFEHVPDYMGFVSKCREKAKYKVYHIPLDLHVSAALRDSYIVARKSVGHLHYFSQSTALATLLDTGHEVVDTMLTPGALELSKLHPSFKTSLANVPRRLLGAANASLAARLFGGYSLLALTK